ncbi:MAG TPA: hypothetical protein PKG52_07250 [bacterium]|nr:hypothetical protein [bacterium]
MKMSLALTTLVLSFVLFSCGDKNTKPENADADTDTYTDNDSDISDEASDVENDIDSTDSEQPDIETDPIDAGLDESFLEPSRGFIFKIVAPLLAESPSGNELKPEEQPLVLKGEITDKNGNRVLISSKKHAYSSVYEDYLYISAGSEYIDKTYYSVSILPSFSTLDWMAENDTDTVNATFFYLYIYRNDIVNDKLFRTCPDAIPDNKGESELQLYLDDNQWNFDEKFGLMVNTYLTFNKKAVADFFGDEMYKLCYCYDIGTDQSKTQRDCTIEDMDTDPTSASNPEPADGEENQALDIQLSWTGSIDPDGGDVKYTLLFGTDNPPDTAIFENSDKTSWKPETSLIKNTQYFWQVSVKDNEGNVTKGKVWTFNTNEAVTETPENDFLIVVNETLNGKLDDELTQYSSDLEKDGYVPAVRYWMPGGAEILHRIIKENYDTYSIKGAVLIGDMPSANYEQMADYGDPAGIIYEEFPSEYFFMDMDGLWEDTDNNGLYDKYPEPLTVEIFTSRITGTYKEISEYLKRVHNYKKNGSFFETRNFFSFIDDDWNSTEDENGNVQDLDYMKNKDWELGSIYGENYERREDRENTTKTTYMDFMTAAGAEFVYQWIHSDPQRIYFDDNFSPNPSNILSIQEIIDGHVKGSFYNLFDCSISRYTEIGGNIASEYIKGEYGLAIIGSTKTGGIFNPEVMNASLATGESWGAAYQLWVNDIWTNYESYGFDKPFIDSWWLGMMIQGDPSLTLTDKKAFVTKQNLKPKKYSREFLDWMNSRIRK